MSGVGAGQRSLLDQQLKRRVRLFRILRTDGTSFLFAEGNATISFRGETYTPVGGVDASEATRSVGVADLEQDFRGLITSDAITDADLRAGLFRGAQVWEYHVDPRVPEAEAFVSDFYTIANVQWGRAVWQAECIGRSRRLTQEVGKKWQRGCWWRLGENFGLTGVAGCKVDLAAITSTTITVTKGSAANAFTVNTGTLSGSPADGYFNNGKVTWVTGDNTGVESTVANYVHSSGTIYLAIPPPHSITTGDKCDIEPGCDFTLAVCDSRYSNTDNYGGSPFIRGTDQALRGVEG